MNGIVATMINCKSIETQNAKRDGNNTKRHIRGPERPSSVELTPLRNKEQVFMLVLLWLFIPSNIGDNLFSLFFLRLWVIFLLKMSLCLLSVHIIAPSFLMIDNGRHPHVAEERILFLCSSSPSPLWRRATTVRATNRNHSTVWNTEWASSNLVSSFLNPQPEPSL